VIIAASEVGFAVRTTLISSVKYSRSY